MVLEVLWQYDCYEVVEWAMCGSGAVSALPTLAWALGAAALSRLLLEALFLRFLFRRVPWWELLLQHLLFVWLLVYSVRLWFVLVPLIKLLVDHILDVMYLDEPFPDARRRYLAQQCAVWACAALPLAAYVRARPRPEPQPLMIWITASPWQRREMGPYGYYLQRPPPPPPPPLHPAPPPPRRARSDPLLHQQHYPKKRCSKSV